MEDTQIEAYNYLRFFVGFQVYKKNPIDVQANPLFERNIDDALKEAKKFLISDKQKQFLVSGKINKNMEIKFPYDKMFLDVCFTKEELKEYGIKIKSEELIGLIITKGYVYPESEQKFIKELGEDIPEKSVGLGIRYTLLLRRIDGKGKEALQFETFVRSVKFDEGFDESMFKEDMPTKDKNAQDFWHNFFLNFIRFVNFPKIILKEHKKTEQNIKRRIKQGRPVIPDYITIELTGELDRYVDTFNTKPKKSWSYTYSFDVKGHYRELASQRYKKSRTIWVEPYKKGTGQYVESIYKINKKGVKCGN